MSSSQTQNITVRQAVSMPSRRGSAPSITFTPPPEEPRGSWARPPSISLLAGPSEAITPFSVHSPAVSLASVHQASPRPRYFHSRRIKDPKTVQKPWLKKRDPREKWVTIIPLMGIAVGMGIAALLVYNGISTVINHKYCEVLSEDWSQGFRKDIWTREVELGGYG